MSNPGGRPNRVGRRDLASGSVTRTLLAFAIPTLATNVLQSLNGSINAMWVGHLVGEAGLAATSNANLIIFALGALCFGVGMAIMIFIGQNMGRGDLYEVRRLVAGGMFLYTLFGVGVALSTWLAAPAILHWLASPANVYPQALAYLRTVLIGFPAGLVFVFLQLALRGSGDSFTPLLFIIPSVLIDVALNPLLIAGLHSAPRLGIAGSAAAGVIANFVSLALLIGYIYWRNLPIRLGRTELGLLLPSSNLILPIIKKGIPMSLQMIVVSSASLAMMGLVNREGTSTVAAYGATSQLWTYIQMPAVAVGMAASTIAAQSIGADRWSRVDQVAGVGIVVNIVLTSALVLLVTIFDRYALGLFLGSNGEAISTGQRINLLAGWSFVISSVMLVLAAIPRANGATVPSLIVMFVSLIPIRLGVAYTLKPLLGSDALWWGFPISYVAATSLTGLYYRYGSWRNVRLLAQSSETQVQHSAR